MLVVKKKINEKSGDSNSSRFDDEGKKCRCVFVRAPRLKLALLTTEPSFLHKQFDWSDHSYHSSLVKM